MQLIGEILIAHTSVSVPEQWPFAQGERLEGKDPLVNRLWYKKQNNTVLSIFLGDYPLRQVITLLAPTVFLLSKYKPSCSINNVYHYEIYF